MKQFLKIGRDDRGLAAIEMAFAIPALLLLIYGMMQTSFLFFARAGMQHAVGEAARQATIFPTPTNSTLQAKVNEELFGMVAASSTPSVNVVSGTANGQFYKDITVTYTRNIDFIFVPSKSVTLTTTKRVFTAQATS